MSGVENRKVAEADAGQRLDRWFKKHFPALGHGRLEKLLRKGQVRVDGGRAKAGLRLEAGQIVRVPPLGDGQAAAPARAKPRYTPSEEEVEALQSAVIYRDKAVLVLNKPAGLAVQGGSGQLKHLDAMLDCLRFDAGERPKLVHRLDKDTSGVLVLARSSEAARSLTRAFREGSVRKLYWAAVAGVPKQAAGEIDLPLAKTGGKGQEKMRPQAEEEGEAALTLYVTVAQAGRKAAWMALRPVTGRTHQLRVHCAALGHPILGDGKYGGKEAFPRIEGLPGQLLLHARSIALPDPLTGTTLRVVAPLPAQMLQAWQALGFNPEARRGDPFDD